MTPELNPIFVHASPRSGSTYFFNVLRRNADLMCFNEAIIDVFSHYGKQQIIGLKEKQKWNVNHNFLDRDDFYEFVAAWDEVMYLYPAFPSFRDYIPPNGVLPSSLYIYLAALMRYARSRGRRPVLCEIHSRGRTGALRTAFAGFHIAQYRDPLSQFGSFFRPVMEGGEWGFLAFPLMELGLSGHHALYRLVPERWRVPVLAWPTNDRAQRWSSAVQYVAMIASPQTGTIEKAFRWFLFSWVLSNLASICYCDAWLDIDKVHDDHAYRKSFVDTLSSKYQIYLDFKDLRKFDRYYEFEAFDTLTICEQVESAIRQAVQSGRAEAAITSLGHSSTIAVRDAVEILLTKIRESLASMAASNDRHYISSSEWKAIAQKRKKIWFNPPVRAIVRGVYPFAAPIISAGRRAGFWN
jgi:hypothetical protein